MHKRFTISICWMAIWMAKRMAKVLQHDLTPFFKDWKVIWIMYLYLPRVLKEKKIAFSENLLRRNLLTELYKVWETRIPKARSFNTERILLSVTSLKRKSKNIYFLDRQEENWTYTAIFDIRICLQRYENQGILSNIATHQWFWKQKSP